MNWINNAKKMENMKSFRKYSPIISSTTNKWHIHSLAIIDIAVPFNSLPNKIKWGNNTRKTLEPNTISNTHTHTHNKPTSTHPPKGRFSQWRRMRERFNMNIPLNIHKSDENWIQTIWVGAVKFSIICHEEGKIGKSRIKNVLFTLNARWSFIVSQMDALIFGCFSSDANWTELFTFIQNHTNNEMGLFFLEFIHKQRNTHVIVICCVLWWNVLKIPYF